MNINSKTNTKSTSTKLVVTAMLSAVAAILQFLEFGVPFAPAFLKVDFSAIPELLGSFAIGPVYGVIICLIKNLIHLPFTTTFGVGNLSNFILGAIFVFIAGTIYKHKKDKKGAIIGSLTGAITMTALGVITNYFVVYPIYAVLLFGGDINIIVSMYQAILPICDNLIKSILIVNVPFTLIKGLLSVFVTYIVYKPLSGLIYSLNTAINKKKTWHNKIINI